MQLDASESEEESGIVFDETPDQPSENRLKYILKIYIFAYPANSNDMIYSFCWGAKLRLSVTERIDACNDKGGCGGLVKKLFGKSIKFYKTNDNYYLILLIIN